MADGIKIKIRGDHDNFEVEIPDEFLLWCQWFGQAASRVYARPEHVQDRDPVSAAREGGDCANAMLVQYRNRTDRQAPPEGTDASEPGGAIVLSGVGPHRVSVTWGGKQVELSISVLSRGVHVDAYERDGPRLLGIAPFEEPS